MTLTAEAVGTAQHRLRRGLILTLRHEDRARTLSLTRYNRPPGEQEEATCRKVFGVPPGARRETHRQHEYHIVRFIWKNEPRLRQTSFMPDAAAGYYHEGG